MALESSWENELYGQRDAAEERKAQEAAPLKRRAGGKRPYFNQPAPAVYRDAVRNSKAAHYLTRLEKAEYADAHGEPGEDVVVVMDEIHRHCSHLLEKPEDQMPPEEIELVAKMLRQ